MTLAAAANNILSNARHVQISGGNFSIVGGDVQSYYHNNSGSRDVIWAALQTIPNFRKIYQDMLGKATSGTGMWLLKSKNFSIWLNPSGDIKIYWGSGMRM